MQAVVKGTYTSRLGAIHHGRLQPGAQFRRTVPTQGFRYGPIFSGRVGTDIILESAIFSYSRSKDLFAGVSLGGTVVAIDDSDNEKVYGKKVKAQDLLSGQVQLNEIVRPFLEALRIYTPVKGYCRKLV